MSPTGIEDENVVTGLMSVTTNLGAIPASSDRFTENSIAADYDVKLCGLRCHATKNLPTDDFDRIHFTGFPRKDTVFSEGCIRRRCLWPNTQPIVELMPHMAL